MNNNQEPLQDYLQRVFSHLPPPFLTQQLREGSFRLNNRKVSLSAPVRTGQLLEILTSVPLLLSPHKGPTTSLDLLYHDADLVVLNKPPTLIVHPFPGWKDSSVVGSLIEEGLLQAEAFPLLYRPGVVQRLDLLTSGVMVVALNPQSQKRLEEQFVCRDIDKRYLALVMGVPEQNQGEICLPLQVRYPRPVQVHPQGKFALTRYWVRERFVAAALLEVQILTGRTHQIRAHMAARQHPILGDVRYSRLPRPSRLKRFLLHSWKLTLRHPSSQQILSFEAPLPNDFQKELEQQRAWLRLVEESGEPDPASPWPQTK